MKNLLKKGKEIIFENENTCHSAECSFRDNLPNWANGFNIMFNGQSFTFKTFNAFEKKLNQLIMDFDLKLKTDEKDI